MKLSAQAREELRRQVREHPGVLDILPSRTTVSTLAKATLLEVAEELKIDVQAILNSPDLPSSGAPPKAKQPEADQPTLGPYAFNGAIEFDFSLQVLGITIERKGRAAYSVTPDWPFVDAVTGATCDGGYSSAIRIEALTVPWEERTETLPDGQRKRFKEPGEWVAFASGEILSEEIWDRIDELIDEKIKVENEGRKTRKVLPAPPPSLSDKSV
jgi:hypothetical protein